MTQKGWDLNNHISKFVGMWTKIGIHQIKEVLMGVRRWQISLNEVDIIIAKKCLKSEWCDAKVHEPTAVSDKFNRDYSFLIEWIHK